MILPRKGSSANSVLMLLTELGKASIKAMVKQRLFTHRAAAENKLDIMAQKGMIVFIDVETVRLTSTMQKYFDDISAVEKPKGSIVAPAYRPAFKPMQPENMLSVQVRKMGRDPLTERGYKSSSTSAEKTFWNEL